MHDYELSLSSWAFVCMYDNCAQSKRVARFVGDWLMSPRFLSRSMKPGPSNPIPRDAPPRYTLIVYKQR